MPAPNPNTTNLKPADSRYERGTSGGQVSFRRAVIAGRLLRVSGQLQREGLVMHLIARRIDDLSPMLDRLGEAGRVDVSSSRADEVKRPVPNRAPPRTWHPREQAKALFPRRDFH